MFPIKNSAILQVFFMQAHTTVFLLYGGKCLKRILTYLYSTRYNEINKGHSYVQKHVSYRKNVINSINILYIGLHKRILILRSKK